MRGLWRKLFGNRGERAAARFLRRKGYRIVSRQWLGRWGEFDLIALDGQTIVFVEVKSRHSAALGHPAEAVGRDKQQRMTRQALAYLKRRRLLKHRARFDVVAIIWPDGVKEPQIQHIVCAFEPMGDGQFFS